MNEAAKKPRQPRMDLAVRRTQVLDAALDLVVRQGYSAVTMEAVARAAELAKPRVYAAYPGRGPLLSALFERERQRAIDALGAAMPEFTEESDFAATLEAAARNMLHAVAAYPDGVRLLLTPADDAPPEVRAHAAQARQVALDNLRGLIAWDRARAGGVLGLDDDLLAESLLAVGEHFVRQAVTNPEEYGPDRLSRFVAHAVEILAAGRRAVG
ncbi:TetR/AcrR family transcriptional regulator [Nocardia brasiliensis]|uniref:TetR/AcrR family transcriptional regulator n=1 Tax=Nocardia brasiliensis TaxID=37326 RepID=UPI000E080E8A|nr:TetR/AcrR family transcriptional regulator [Nocardia brasiliensis]SUB47519.1 pyrimidine utilization regulatory protein R [Nocardia brasiliensis]